LLNIGMNLNAYFKCHGHQAAGEVAKKAGTTLGYLRGCLYGQRRMSADVAIRLEAATDGEMTAIELRPDLPWRGFSSAGVHCHCPPTSSIESAA
jgi:DNA-binding transcriptional regulator YdaS (Cro superfamily)